MSTIRVVYQGAPPVFPATDQHPDAVRYQVGPYWVDAIGGEPTLEQIEAMLNPQKATNAGPTVDDLRALIASHNRGTA